MCQQTGGLHVSCPREHVHRGGGGEGVAEANFHRFLFVFRFKVSNAHVFFSANNNAGNETAADTISFRSPCSPFCPEIKTLV